MSGRTRAPYRRNPTELKRALAKHQLACGKCSRAPGQRLIRIDGTYPRLCEEAFQILRVFKPEKVQ